VEGSSHAKNRLDSFSRFNYYYLLRPKAAQHNITITKTVEKHKKLKTKIHKKLETIKQITQQMKPWYMDQFTTVFLSNDRTPTCDRHRQTDTGPWLVSALACSVARVKIVRNMRCNSCDRHSSYTLFLFPNDY